MLIKKLLAKATTEQRGLASKLAEIAQCKPAAVSKFINEKDREFDNFEGLLNIIRYLFPDREHEIMIDYSRKICVTNKTARCMLEYFSINRMVVYFAETIDRLKKSSNRVSKEFALLYEFFLHRQVGRTDVNSMSSLYAIRKIPVSSDETMAYQSILELYFFYHRKEYKLLSELIESTKLLVNHLQEGYLKKAYSIRILEMEAIMQFRMFNNTDLSRLISNEILRINFNTRFNAFAYYVKGMSYFFSSYSESLFYLVKSVDEYQKIEHMESIYEVKESIETLNAFWQVNSDYETKKNQILYNALSGIPTKLEHSLDVEFLHLIDGIINKSVNSLIESMIGFLKKGNSFFANIPFIELKKLNYDLSFVETLMDINNK